MRNKSFSIIQDLFLVYLLFIITLPAIITIYSLGVSSALKSDPHTAQEQTGELASRVAIPLRQSLGSDDSVCVSRIDLGTGDNEPNVFTYFAFSYWLFPRKVTDRKSVQECAQAKPTIIYDVSTDRISKEVIGYNLVKDFQSGKFYIRLYENSHD